MGEKSENWGSSRSGWEDVFVKTNLNEAKVFAWDRDRGGGGVVEEGLQRPRTSIKALNI